MFCEIYLYSFLPFLVPLYKEKDESFCLVLLACIGLNCLSQSFREIIQIQVVGIYYSLVVCRIWKMQPFEEIKKLIFEEFLIKTTFCKEMLFVHAFTLGMRSIHMRWILHV
jgi:hypothetical protein